MRTKFNEKSVQAIFDSLTKLYEEWCAVQGLECIDADELVLAHEVNTKQRIWLVKFADVWGRVHTLTTD